MAPKISVIMPVYNGADFVRTAINSILKQSWEDFELILINDGSTDESLKIIESYSDARIRVINNQNNIGLSAARNIGLEAALGKYIAWLDCDDVSKPTRLEKQYQLLESDQTIGLCGTWVETLGNNKKQEWKYPTNPEFLRCRMIFDDPVATSSVMLRRSVIEHDCMRFDLDCPPAEDYDLWERISCRSRIANIPEFLTQYRIHGNQTSVMRAEQQKIAVWKIQSRLIAQLGLTASNEEKLIHLEIGAAWHFSGEKVSVFAAKQWLEKLAATNRKVEFFPEPAFQQVLAERWAAICKAATRQGFYAWKIFWNSPLSRFSLLSYPGKAKFFAKSLAAI
jgi:glycosyltransferase involved in cell wall biosynthesis